MTVLVTGGAGYIGSHTVRALRARGREVVVLDNLSNGHEFAVLGAPLVTGDIDDGVLVEKTVAEFEVDACIHFAALKAVADSMEQPARYFRNNVAGSNTLLEALGRGGVERVVFSSSAAVYGTPEANPIEEDAPLRPESVYGETKLMVERMLRWFDVTSGLRSVSLRYFNAAGAASDGTLGEDFTATQNLVPVLMRAALGRGGPLRLFGTDYPTPDGTAVRDYIHVEDLSEAHVLAAGVPGARRAVDGVQPRHRRGLERAGGARRGPACVIGRPIPVERWPRRPGDPVALVADTTRAADLLGWQPTKSLDEIVASAWQWHAAHPDGWGS